nr:MAG TPA: hypothetical protein [Caudoviricetes sp.]
MGFINKILYYFDMMLVSINSTEPQLDTIEKDLDKTKEVATKVVQISLAVSEIVVLLFKVYGVFVNTSNVITTGALGSTSDKSNSYKALDDLQKHIDIEMLQNVLDSDVEVSLEDVNKLHNEVETYKKSLLDRSNS